MSFDVNFSMNKPVIKAAAGMNNDGGSAGNTGYMSQGRKKNQNNNGSLFDNDENKNDFFSLSSKIPSLDEDMDFNDGPSWVQKLAKTFGK